MSPEIYQFLERASPVLILWSFGFTVIHLHAQIDERHAEEFFAVIEPPWDDERRRYYIEQGLELGAYIFDRLYCDMYAASREETAPGGSATS